MDIDKLEINIDEYDKISSECRILAINKNSDYGIKPLKLFKGMSIFVRIYDKVERLKRLYENNKEHKVDENIEDTIKDIINYSLYLLMMERGKLEKIK